MSGICFKFFIKYVSQMMQKDLMPVNIGDFMLGFIIIVS